MKSLFLAVVCLMLTASITNAQVIREADVPGAVKSKMQSMFPDANAAVWKQDQPGFLSVDFVQAKIRKNATFTGSGGWVSTETSIRQDEMPPAANDFLRTNYPDGKVSSCVVAETATKKTYECRVKSKGVSYDVVFDTEGKLAMKPQIVE